MSRLAPRSGGEQTHAYASSHAALFTVPLSAVLPGLDSRGFLIGQADPADTVTSPPVVHGDIPLPGGGG